jgi:hypothetical protein
MPHDWALLIYIRPFVVRLSKADPQRGCPEKPWRYLPYGETGQGSP